MRRLHAHETGVERGPGEQIAEPDDLTHRGHDRPAALSRRRHGDARPAFDCARAPGGCRQRHVLGDERHDRRDSERHGITHHPAHLIALEQGHRERHGHRRFGQRRERIDDIDEDLVARRPSDSPEPLPAPPVEQHQFVAFAEPQHTRQMVGLIVVDARPRAVDPRDVASVSRHVSRYTLHAMVFRGQTLGKYRILEPLGSGGFGTVYLAEDTWIDKRVALKVPHRQTLDFGELLREPRLLAALNHPNIVTVVTAEKQDGVFFIVMEYVPGETLETIIVERGPLELAVALDYTCQILNAVDHAHKQNVIHRDLRPANVFVTERGLLKVGDFGTSRFLELAAHGTTVIGSPPYMAPEQFDGRAVFASDLYSVGVTMYQMLTGQLPYDMPTPSELDRLRTGELISSARLVNPSIPVAIDKVILKALHADIEARYQRAEDVLEDILAARTELVRRPAPTPAPTPVRTAHATTPVTRPAQERVRPAESVANRFCWHCRKPLPARAGRCPFCGESQ